MSVHSAVAAAVEENKLNLIGESFPPLLASFQRRIRSLLKTRHSPHGTIPDGVSSSLTVVRSLRCFVASWVQNELGKKDLELHDERTQTLKATLEAAAAIPCGFASDLAEVLVCQSSAAAQRERHAEIVTFTAVESLSLSRALESLLKSAIGISWPAAEVLLKDIRRASLSLLQSSRDSPSLCAALSNFGFWKRLKLTPPLRAERNSLLSSHKTSIVAASRYCMETHF